MKLQIFCSQGRREVRRRNFPYLAMKTDYQWRSRSSDLWQSRLSKSAKAKLQSLDVQAEMKCGSGTSHLWKSWQSKCGKRNFRSLSVKAERKCGSRTSHIWQSRQIGSAEAELHIFGSQSRTKVRTWNFRSLAVKAERKCRSGTSGFCSQGRAEV